MESYGGTSRGYGETDFAEGSVACRNEARFGVGEPRPARRRRSLAGCVGRFSELVEVHLGADALGWTTLACVELAWLANRTRSHVRPAKIGGVDGTRTRGLRRDRPAF